MLPSAKEQVRELLDDIPDNATLNDIRYELNDRLYRLHVKQEIELGMKESREGQITSHAEVRKRFTHGQR